MLVVRGLFFHLLPECWDECVGMVFSVFPHLIFIDHKKKSIPFSLGGIKHKFQGRVKLINLWYSNIEYNVRNARVIYGKGISNAYGC